MQKNKGFTIIEILVMVASLVIISLVAFSFLSITLLNSSKAMATKEVRQNGNLALSTIERLVISAKSVECPSQTQLNITSVNNESMVISCSDNYISSDSSRLTNNKVVISNCNFVCTSTEGVPLVVEVGFTASINSSGRASEISTQSFENKFVVRNQLD